MRKKVSAMFLRSLHHSSGPQLLSFQLSEKDKEAGIIRRRNLGFKIELAPLPSSSYTAQARRSQCFLAVSWLKILCDAYQLVPLFGTPNIPWTMSGLLSFYLQIQLHCYVSMVWYQMLTKVSL